LLDGGLLVATKAGQAGDEVFVDYETDYDWDWLKAAYIPQLVGWVGLAREHYDEEPLEWLEHMCGGPIDLPEWRRGSGVQLLLAHFVDFRADTGNVNMLGVRDHVPRQGLGPSEEAHWLEQLLTSVSFTAAFGFWGTQRGAAVELVRMAEVLPLHKLHASSRGRVTRAPVSYAEQAVVTTVPEAAVGWTPRYIPAPPAVAAALGEEQGSVFEEGRHSAEEADLEAAELVLMNINVDGVNPGSYADICSLIQRQGVDITVLVDTRRRPGDRALVSAVKAALGTRYKVFTHVDANASEDHAKRVGGMAFVVGPRVTRPKLERLCPYGSSAAMSGWLGAAPVYVMGTYWPQERTDAKATDTLWHKVGHGAGMDTVRYLKRLAVSALGRAREDGYSTFMVGDLNTDVSRGDRYDLTGFLEEADMVHSSEGPLLRTPSYRSNLGGGMTVRSRLDYQLHAPRAVISSSCFPLLYDTMYTGLHSPVVGRYMMTVGAVNPVGQPLPKWSAVEVRLKQTAKVAKLKGLLEILRLPEGTAEYRLETINALVVKTVAKVFKGGGGPSTKDGWSPATRCRTIALEHIKLIMRHTRGSRKYSKWTVDTYEMGRRRVLAAWRKAVRELAEEPGDIYDLLNPEHCHYGYDYWVHKDLPTMEKLAEKAFDAVRKSVHGRKRRDNRAAFGGYMSLLETDRQAGLMRRSVALLAGKKPRATFSMDSVVHHGVTVTEPVAVDRLLTEHFDDWFARKPSHLEDGIEGAGADWRTMEEPLEEFQQRYRRHNIPADVLEILWRSLQRKTEKVYTEMEICPTIEELRSTIAHLPKDSAPGISGMSYNMLKVLPDRVVGALYKAMADIWQSRALPAFWKWRWILPIPKEQDPTLDDLRPLSLFETTRKVWFAMVMVKLRARWAQDGLLHDAQNMFIKGRSMDLSVLALLNVLETAKEWKSDVFLSSWDITRAFDRVPIQAQIWAYVRLGVPAAVAEYMVAFDIDCRAVVRTPLACQAWKDGRYEALGRLGYTPEVGMAQGNVDSTDKWAALTHCSVRWRRSIMATSSINSVARSWIGRGIRRRRTIWFHLPVPTRLSRIRRT
jgi:hypothetical protein